MARYHGKSGRLYAAVSGTGTAIAVASLSGWSLDMTSDRVDTTCFEDGNKTSVQGFPAAKGTFAGFLDNTEETLYLAQEAADGTKLYLYPNRNIATKYWYGPAWLDYSVDTAVNNAIPVKGSFVANGSWARHWS